MAWVCPVCVCTDTATFFVKLSRPLLICRQCRHVWWRDFPSESELTALYSGPYTKRMGEERLQHEGREYYKTHLRELLDIAGRQAADTTILDYGCSIPVLLDEARKVSFGAAWGVDYAEEAHQAGREWGIPMLVPRDLSVVPDASLDIVRFSHTLEHSPAPLEVLAAVIPKLRPGGLVYITQPNFPVFRFAESPLDLKDTDYPTHLQFFSALSLVEMVRRAGLSVVRFFSHQNEAAVMSAYGGTVDLEYSRERLAEYESKGDRFFPEFSNYPYYAGENSVLYATTPL